ncbi:hypothetical protein [Bacillus sp. Marseille-Q3570]|uniref:hypothetical protein n=1 Tax=Bacillus sp. Marseille-Q3570 TaxID=2963522 RepID=UPI0021B7E8C7|nr:hypothetical protein [Bacillus sp. Marseille-Q3570]
MHINGMVDLFSKRFEEQSYLSPFFRLNEYVVSLADGEECVSLHLRKRSCKVIMGEEVDQHTIRINGRMIALQSLVEGRQKLTELIAQGEIETNASYRTILKLESIFYLLRKQTRDAV